MPRRAQPPPEPIPDPRPQVDLNQVVAYNVRAARELRGWTQEEFADRLEQYWGQRLTQGGVSAFERAWDGERRREFDAHQLLIFAMVFDLPIIWFLLPPKGDHRLMRGTTRQVDELYSWLLGRPEQLGPVYARLREYGFRDPSAAEEIVEQLTGHPAASRQWSYKERRKEMLLALLDDHADSFDSAVDELGRWFDRLRQTGLRGFIAEHTHDDDFTYVTPPEWLPDPAANDTPPDHTASDDIPDETTPDDTEDETTRGIRGRRRRRP
jgi:transcriptional regulator with XRE-family HTH domain